MKASFYYKQSGMKHVAILAVLLFSWIISCHVSISNGHVQKNEKQIDRLDDNDNIASKGKEVQEEEERSSSSSHLLERYDSSISRVSSARGLQIGEDEPLPTTAGPSQSPTTSKPSESPSKSPSISKPSQNPTTSRPSKSPSKSPVTSKPSQSPTTSRPSKSPSRSPTTSNPTQSPTTSRPSKSPSKSPTTSRPSKAPTRDPTTSKPSNLPSQSPTTSRPTKSPSKSPTTSKPSRSPSKSPTTSNPTKSPSRSPTTSRPSKSPTKDPTGTPTFSPTTSRPTKSPSRSPSRNPTTSTPSKGPSKSPTTSSPTKSPSRAPTTSRPSKSPTIRPTTLQPTKQPTNSPTTSTPTQSPTTPKPSKSPSRSPTTSRPSKSPTTSKPTKSPSRSPTGTPTVPTESPTQMPTTLSPTPTGRAFPSVLIMMADDMGYTDVGYYGGLARTPNLDDLANGPNSLRLDNFHAGSAVCSPSRASMLSGRNPERDCVLGPILAYSVYNFRLDMPSMARYAKNAGYRTAHFGKWHLGRAPGVVGFERWVQAKINLPTWDPACFCPERKCIGSCKARNANCYRVPGARCASRKTNKCFMGHLESSIDMGAGTWDCTMSSGQAINKKTKIVNFPRGISAADHVSNIAVTYLGSIKKTDPFFIQVHFVEPHRPFFASPQAVADCFNGTTCRPEIQQYGENSIVVNYYAVIENMDRAVGKIMNKLKNMNRLEDTIVIFVSDNGPERPDMGGLPDIETRWLRDYKRSVYEGGYRVPAIISWPQRIKSNFQVKESTSMLDLFVTLTDAMLEINPNIGDKEPLPRSDGQSLLPLIDNPAGWMRTKTYGICMPVTAKHTELCSTFAYHEGRFKVVINELNYAAPEVYDTINDLREQTNLAGMISDWAGMVNRAKDWRDLIYAESITKCQDSTKPPSKKKRKKKKSG